MSTAYKIGDIKAAVKRLQSQSRNGAPLEVVDTFGNLPEHIKKQYRKRGMVGGVRGASDGKTVYLVADAFASVDQAVGLWMHEQGGHHGLRGLVGDDARIKTLMDSVFGRFGTDNPDHIRQAYGLDFNNPAHRREAAEEMLAHLAEKMGTGLELTELEMSAWNP